MRRRSRPEFVPPFAERRPVPWWVDVLVSGFSTGMLIALVLVIVLR